MIPIGDDPPPRRSFPIVTITLIAVNIVVFVYELMVPNTDVLFRSAGVTPLEFATGRDIAPAAPYGIYYATLLTSMFLHGGFLHIGSNMLFLWIFGDNVEDRLGHLKFLLFYLLCGIGATVAQVAFTASSNIPNLGASGAIAGVLAAYLILFPKGQVRVLMGRGIVPMPALMVIGLWIVLQFVNGVGS